MRQRPRWDVEPGHARAASGGRENARRDDAGTGWVDAPGDGRGHGFGYGMGAARHQAAPAAACGSHKSYLPQKS